jgi:hypothetical protein
MPISTLVSLLSKLEGYMNEIEAFAANRSSIDHMFARFRFTEVDKNRPRINSD